MLDNDSTKSDVISTAKGTIASFQFSTIFISSNARCFLGSSDVSQRSRNDRLDRRIKRLETQRASVKTSLEGMQHITKTKESQVSTLAFCFDSIFRNLQEIIYDSQNDAFPYPTSRKRHDLRRLASKCSNHRSTSKATIETKEDRVDPIANVRTADDAVEFYSQYGQDSPIKFFYCNRCSNPTEAKILFSFRESGSLTYLPYDLIVVSKEQTSAKEYFTISATGVVCIRKSERYERNRIECGSEAPAEFTPLSDWVRERILFRLLKNFKFFKFNDEMRCFFHWRKVSHFIPEDLSLLQVVRQSLFKRLRKRIGRQLFLTLPTFSSPLIDLHSKMHEIQNLDFCPAFPHRTCPLDEFKDLQSRNRESSTRPRLGEIADCVQMVRFPLPAFSELR